MDENLSEEIWVDARGWEEVYSVSSHGRIKRLLPGRSVRPGRIVEGSLDVNGYRRTKLSYGEKSEHILFHRLVALSFLGDPPEGKNYVLHGDGNPGNNHVSNLRWGNAQDNADDAVRHGTAQGSNTKRGQTECLRGHPLSPENVQVDKLGRRNCRQCIAIRKRRYAEKGLPDGDPRHGTLNAYLHWQCRCPVCREEYSAWSQNRREQTKRLLQG